MSLVPCSFADEALAPADNAAWVELAVQMRSSSTIQSWSPSVRMDCLARLVARRDLAEDKRTDLEGAACGPKLAQRKDLHSLDHPSYWVDSHHGFEVERVLVHFCSQIVEGICHGDPVGSCHVTPRC